MGSILQSLFLYLDTSIGTLRYGCLYCCRTTPRKNLGTRERKSNFLVASPVIKILYTLIAVGFETRSLIDFCTDRQIPARRTLVILQKLQSNFKTCPDQKQWKRDRTSSLLLSETRGLLSIVAFLRAADILLDQFQLLYLGLIYFCRIAFCQTNPGTICFISMVKAALIRMFSQCFHKPLNRGLSKDCRIIFDLLPELVQRYRTLSDIVKPFTIESIKIVRHLRYRAYLHYN